MKKHEGHVIAFYPNRETRKEFTPDIACVLIAINPATSNLTEFLKSVTDRIFEAIEKKQFYVKEIKFNFPHDFSFADVEFLIPKVRAFFLKMCDLPQRVTALWSGYDPAIIDLLNEGELPLSWIHTMNFSKIANDLLTVIGIESILNNNPSIINFVNRLNKSFETDISIDYIVPAKRRIRAKTVQDLLNRNRRINSLFTEIKILLMLSCKCKNSCFHRLKDIVRWHIIPRLRLTDWKDVCLKPQRKRIKHE